MKRKFFYVWTCEYCFSHWVAAVVVSLTGYRALYEDWRGWLAAVFLLVALANVAMTGYQIARANLRRYQALADKATEDAKYAKAMNLTPAPSI